MSFRTSPVGVYKGGNERVITARFNDARFFFDEDRKSGLADKVESLKSVLFHKDLGSIYDKVERMRFISAHLAAVLGLDAETAGKIDRAVSLCKADLNTAMVFEFTSLQGKMGRIYALLDGEDPEVADAIDDHYRPRSQDDPMPEGIISRVLSLAEKLDNLLGSYSVGNIPKGSQDPYALRRQAGAIVEMAVDGGMSIDMRALLEHCASKYRDGAALVKPILSVIGGRANTLFAERGFRYDEIDACLSIDYHNYLEQFRRAHSLHEFRGRRGFSEMLLSFKRMNNIVAAFRQKQPEYLLAFDPCLYVRRPSAGFTNSQFPPRKNRRLDPVGQLQELFGLLIEGKAAVDIFFDKVMVMSMMSGSVTIAWRCSRRSSSRSGGSSISPRSRNRRENEALRRRVCYIWRAFFENNCNMYYFGRRSTCCSIRVSPAPRSEVRWYARRWIEP